MRKEKSLLKSISRKNYISKIIFLSCFFFAFTNLQAAIRIAHIFSDNMVLQRDKPIKIWGWANKNETFDVCFMNKSKKVKADKSGYWTVILDKAPAGGPYVLEIKGKDNKVSLQNILIGDVWLCSGQSNMEMPINGWGSVYNYQNEIDNAEYPEIRAFNVVKNMEAAPQNDLDGGWVVCSPQTAADFSAVAYFFARKLNAELGIPIGIINSSWGGTEIETWISEGAYKNLPDEFQNKYEKINIANIEQFAKNNESNKNSYLDAMKNDSGITDKWYIPTTDVSSWGKMQIPQMWEGILGDIDGVVWFRYDLDLPAGDYAKQASIRLGTIDDDDAVWINGVKVGETQGYAVDRLYNIPSGTLKSGTNTITVKVSDYAGGGGIYGNPDNLYLTTVDNKYSLSGEWLYKVSVTNTEFNYVNISPNMRYALLYNTMINPITKLPIKGTIWYQGESNASNGIKYRTLFPTMINDWREQWGYDFPFYWVQLANYMSKDKTPQESDWANLREAQTLTLSIPNTGQAVITDIGDADDIHPKNKQDVGLRIASVALNKTYNMDNVVCDGPTFKSMDKIGNKIKIEYDNIAEGLVVNNKYGYIEGFAIAGEDKEFKWAKAYLEGNQVIVYSEEVPNPVAIRYSWSNNPDVNLYNSSGLPSAPFRTDNW